MNAIAQAVATAVAPVKLDLGCGSRKQAGYTGVDIIDFPGVDVVCDLRKAPWPFDTDSVDESTCAHFIEHLTNQNGKFERVAFLNELWRITKPGGKCTLVLPHWASNRYYGDPTHCEPFAEFSFYYLDPEWRLREAPHTDIKYNPNGYVCNWSCQWGYGMHPTLTTRSAEYRQFALEWFKEAALDLHCTMIARKP